MNRYANQTLLSLEGKYLFTHSFPAPSEDRNLYTCVYTVSIETEGEEKELFVFILSVLSYQRMPVSINNVSV